MKVLYRPLKICLLISAMLVTAVSHAQYKSYAVAKENSSDAAINRSVITDPVVKVKSRTDKSVNLIWSAWSGDVSQYILERSVDGKRFQEIAEFVTVMSNEEPYYEFTDRFKSSYMGPLFYRVRVEGLDGGIVYTPVTIMNAITNLQ